MKLTKTPKPYKPTNRFHHAPSPDNPHKGAVIDVSTDVPYLPRQVREKDPDLLYP